MKRESTTSSSLGINTHATPLSRKKLVRTYSILKNTIKLKDMDDPKLMTIAKALSRRSKAFR